MSEIKIFFMLYVLKLINKQASTAYLSANVAKIMCIIIHKRIKKIRTISRPDQVVNYQKV